MCTNLFVIFRKHGVNIQNACFSWPHHLFQQFIFSRSHLGMGSICSRRRSVLIPFLLPAPLLAHIQAFNRPSASSLRARRRWQRAGRRIITLLRLRKIWASLGRYLNNSGTGQLFDHLRRRNGRLTTIPKARSQPAASSSTQF